MRKNSLWRGPFIQIPADSVESLIPFLSLRARGWEKSGKEEGESQKAFHRPPDDKSHCAIAKISERRAYRLLVELRGRILSNKPCSNHHIQAKPTVLQCISCHCFLQYRCGWQMQFHARLFYFPHQRLYIGVMYKIICASLFMAFLCISRRGISTKAW